MGKTTAFISAGHYPKAPGAYNKKLRLKEHFEAQKVVKLLLKKNDRQSAIELAEAPVGNQTEKVGYINSCAGAGDVAVEIHFNAFAPNSAAGIETWHFPGSVRGKFLASRLQDTLFSLLPFPSRGIKQNDDLYFLAATKVPAVIVETLFLDNDREAGYLLYPRAHALIASALFAGIKAYVNHYFQKESQP